MSGAYPDQVPTERKRRSHIKLTSHPGGVAHLPIVWGEADPKVRGPVIGSTSVAEHRNVIGTHAGSYAIYRALAVASGALDPTRRPDLTDTAPTNRVGPHPQWFEPDRIVSLDPFGAVVADVYADRLAEGYDIRPTIAITTANVDVPEIGRAIEAGRLRPDGAILRASGLAASAWVTSSRTTDQSRRSAAASAAKRWKTRRFEAASGSSPRK